MHYAYMHLYAFSKTVLNLLVINNFLKVAQKYTKNL